MLTTAEHGQSNHKSQQEYPGLFINKLSVMLLINRAIQA